MNHRARRIVETAACERRYGLADEKGAEYSGKGATYKEDGADTLANFKAVGERLGVSPVSVLLTYWLKHVDSITTAVREAEDGFCNDVGRSIRYAQGEGIVSRLDDARNYLDLLECLLIDTNAIGTHPEGEYEFHVPAKEVPWRKMTDWKAKENDPNGTDWQSRANQAAQIDSRGLIQSLDGVMRPPAVKDESVKNPGETQTPICETGEWT